MMSDNLNKTTGGTSPFDAIRHVNDAGGEYWSARELGKLLGYTEYGKFRNAIQKAQEACEESGREVTDHFAHVSDMIAVGKGARRLVQDVHLSRYACYLTVQNADPDKPQVALGQTYFAVRTREAERADELAALPEAQRRIRMRNEVVDRNIELAAAAQSAGVVTGRDFAMFQDHGYRGLYAGETARIIAERKGLAKGEKILDRMGSEELAANWFRITQTEAKLVRDGITEKGAANKAHHDVGAAVRRFIVEDLGGTPSEQLPTPALSIKQLERAEAKRIESERQPSHFAELEGPAEGEE